MVAQAEATVTSAEADRLRTQQDLVRYRELAQSAAASRQRLETAESRQELRDRAV